jgi:sialic acid synthase SpsE
MTPAKVFIIAEAGVNHNGDEAMAHDLVDVAAEAGVDAVKFQTWDRDLVTRRDNPLVPYQKANVDDVSDMYELGKTFELALDVFESLAARCGDKGVQFLSTACDKPSLAFLVEKIDIPLIKVPSGEAVNVPFLRAVAETGRPVILSTGMCDMDDVQLAINTLKAVWDKTGVNPGLSLLHCTTAYPTPPEDVHLRSMTTLAETFGLPVGLSDHSEGTTAAAAAVALGAGIIEKHFTLDRDLPGPDHKASVDVPGLRRLVEHIRETEVMLGSGEKVLRPIEEQVVKSVRRSLVATRDITKGEAITEDDIVPLRPEDGIPARDIDKVVGRKAWRDFKNGEVLQWD